MAQPVPRRRRSIRARISEAMCSGTAPPERRNEPSIKSRRSRTSAGGRVVKTAKRRDDRARLRMVMAPLRESCSRSVRRGTAARCQSAPPGSPRRAPRGAGPPRRKRRGHPRLPPADPLRHAGLEQPHDLTGRPGVTSAKAPSPIFSPRDPRIAPSSCRGKQTPAASKKEPPVVAAEHHDRFNA